MAAWQLCCGCGACAALCPDQIEMIDTLEYGRRPRRIGGTTGNSMDEAMAVCPGIRLTRLPKPCDQIGNDQFYEVWGPVLGVWEGYAADSQIRFEGSSGGAATALALFGMERLGMHGTLHIRARDDVPYLNKTVFSVDRGELLAGAGSRYAPASPCDGLSQVESSSGPCVFIGKPCDVAAIHKAIELRPQLAEKIGLTIAFFCAGTPSTAGTLEMLRQMGVEDPASVESLRYRGRGWPGMATVAYRDHENALQRRELTYEQSWGDILQKYRQWRCYICPDHIGEYADIAVADAWHRSVRDHQPGRSVMIARTPRGKAILEQALEKGFLEAESVSPDILPLCRPGQAQYQGGLWARVQTLRMMGAPVPKYIGFGLFGLWRSKLSIGEKIHSILSTVKRFFVKTLYRPRDMILYTVSTNESSKPRQPSEFDKVANHVS